MTDAPNPDTEATDPKVTTPETPTPEPTDAGPTPAATKPATEPAATPATEPAAEPTTKPARQTATKPATKQATKPATKPATKQATKQATEPAIKPALPPTTAPATAKKKPDTSAPYIWATGRRKTAVARVRIRPGDGEFVINKRKVTEYFKLDKDQQAIRTPLEVTDTSKSMDVIVNVVGGGLSGQAGAILLGVARALLKADPDFGPKLKEHNLLTRDPRKVERKKYGQRGARRRFQFSKR